ncbi:hypothetical protein Htur_1275 [Haloterrigena turkmenica DSM 5511]|uniref:MarR family transcriptional regulator n=1 Tax=Haloterrigena turkmenica (strain ATCC 51198 / DSM 5511 / JCM 9101 / NCIMB 13204 / VKM B-1734 / 4k) TaxID=543526 RepID=D2RPD1_HALTV|nr:hypothetical protein [Haloterrigena turkmenica]ADB60165.1 hypothetical protein Htur_1275 [Haloterrigena turkmenica DSM 5511]
MSTSERRLTVPNEIASPQAKLVYLAVHVTDEPTVTRLQQLLGLSKLTLLPLLASLDDRDLVRRTEDGYVGR